MKKEMSMEVRFLIAFALTGLVLFLPPYFYKPAHDPNQALFRVQHSDDQLGVTFDYSDGRAAAKKTFQFTKNSYLVQVTSQVSENGVQIPHSLTWRGGFGDNSIVNAATVESSL